MSRYVIWTSDENLEVLVGFDEGMEGFFLTIADARQCTGEADTYLFHNLDHHAAAQMTLEEVIANLSRFGLTLPSDLAQQLASEGNCCCPAVLVKLNDTGTQSLSRMPRTTGWQSAV